MFTILWLEKKLMGNTVDTWTMQELGAQTPQHSKKIYI